MKVFICTLLLILIAGCSPQPNDASYKTIMVKANGFIETTPNQASFWVALSCEKTSLKDAKQCLIEQSNELTQSFIKMGVEQKDLLTTAINLEKSYDWTSNGNVFKGYNASTTILVTVKNIDKLDAIYTDLLEKRNLEIYGLSYSHNNLESLKGEAHRNALKNAKIIATSILKDLPEDNLEVLKVGNIEITATLPETMDKMVSREQNDGMEMSIAPSSVKINKGTVRVDAQLFVEYHIK